MPNGVAVRVATLISSETPLQLAVGVGTEVCLASLGVVRSLVRAGVVAVGAVAAAQSKAALAAWSVPALFRRVWARGRGGVGAGAAGAGAVLLGARGGWLAGRGVAPEAAKGEVLVGR